MLSEKWVKKHLIEKSLHQMNSAEKKESITAVLISVCYLPFSVILGMLVQELFPVTLHRL